MSDVYRRQIMTYDLAPRIITFLGPPRLKDHGFPQINFVPIIRRKYLLYIATKKFIGFEKYLDYILILLNYSDTLSITIYDTFSSIL